MATNTKKARAVETSNAQINATIKSLKSATTKVRTLIQTGIQQCVEHAKNYGDATGAARLVSAIPQEYRRAEVIRHFADYSPIRVTSQGRGKPMKASLRKPDDQGYNDWNLEGLKAHPWWERDNIRKQDERDMQPFDEEAALGRVVNLANFLQNKAETVNKVKLDPETGEPMKDESGEYIRSNNVENDDRDKLRANAMMLRMIAKDPHKAAQLLGLPKDLVAALSDVPASTQSDTTDEDKKLMEGEQHQTVAA